MFQGPSAGRRKRELWSSLSETKSAPRLSIGNGVVWSDCVSSLRWGCAGLGGEPAPFAPGRSETCGPPKESADQRAIKRGAPLVGNCPPQGDDRTLSRARRPLKKMVAA